MNSKPFLAPVLLGFVLAALGPLVAVITLSGFEWNLIDQPIWGGAANFFRPEFLSSLGATTGIGCLVLIAQLGLGGVLGYQLRGRVSAIYLLPWLTAPIAIGVIWRWLLAPTGGLISNAIGFRLPLLTDDALAPITVALVIAWAGIGYTALVFGAGLSNLQKHISDAAILDGASRLKTFWHIQLPQLRKLIFFLVVTVTLQSMSTYDIIWILTGGTSTTNVASIHIIDAALKTFEVGGASAMSIQFALFEIAVLLIEYAIYRLVTRRFND